MRATKRKSNGEQGSESEREREREREREGEGEGEKVCVFTTPDTRFSKWNG